MSLDRLKGYDYRNGKCDNDHIGDGHGCFNGYGSDRLDGEWSSSFNGSGDGSGYGSGYGWLDGRGDGIGYGNFCGRGKGNGSGVG